MRVKEFLAKHVIVNPAAWLLVEKGAFCFWVKMDISQFGQHGTLPFMGNCGGVPDLVNARIIYTDI
jgi:hypothetical protein